MRIIKDTVRNVKALVKKATLLMYRSVGLIKKGWMSFIEDCNDWLSENASKVFKVGNWYDVRYNSDDTTLVDPSLVSQIQITKKTKCFVTCLHEGRVMRLKIKNILGKEVVVLGSSSHSPFCTCY